MSNLFSNILSGAIKTFQEAATVIETTWAGAVKAFPELGQFADQEVRQLKQAASNAFDFKDNILDPRFGDAVGMAESAADTLVMSLTHGAIAPGLPLLNIGLSQGFALMHAALDHAEAEAKAKFGLPPPDAAATPLVTAGLTAAAAAVNKADPQPAGL